MEFLKIEVLFLTQTKLVALSQDSQKDRDSTRSFSNELNYKILLIF